MRPRNVISVFVSKVDGLIGHHGELKLAIHNKRNEATLESELVTQFVLQSVVLWESFLSDLILSYIVASPTRAIQSIETRLKESVESKFGKNVRRAINFSKPKNKSKKTISALLDPNGWNLTFQNSGNLSTRVSMYLESRNAKKFSLDSADSEFFDYLVCMRNYLSHYSSGARSKLQDSIDSLSDNKNTPFKARIGNIGNYLKNRIGSESRAILIVMRIRDVANKL